MRSSIGPVDRVTSFVTPPAAIAGADRSRPRSIPHGKLHYGKNEVDGAISSPVIGQQVSDAYLSGLRRDGVSYVFAGRDGKDLAAPLKRLKGSSASCLSPCRAAALSMGLPEGRLDR